MEAITTNHNIITRLNPKEDSLGSILNVKDWKVFSLNAFYFDPESGTMNDGLPMDGIKPVIRENHRLMRDLLIDYGVIPMLSEELASNQNIWKLVNKATYDLLDGLRNKLRRVSEFLKPTMNYDASDCVFHMVMCHTPERISCVYANLFTIVKIGSLTKVWINYNIWDG